MDDAFDEFLRNSLAPAVRPADRHYVLRVQARIALEDKWQIERRAALVRLALEFLAIAALAAALLLMSRAPTILEFATRAPAAALGVALAAFGLLVFSLIGRSGAANPGAVLRLH